MLETRIAHPPADLPGEMTLVEYIRLLWSYRLWIAGGTALGLLAAIGVTLTTPRTYQATVALIMANSKLGEDPRGTALSVATVRELLTTRAGATRVIAQLGLDKPPHNLRPAGLLSRVTVEEIRNTAVVKVYVRMPDPALAASVANALATSAIEQLKSSNQNEVVIARDLIKSQRDEAEASYRAAQNRLVDFKRTAQLDIKKGDASVMLTQRQALKELLVSIEEEKAWLAKAATELAGRTRIMTLNRALDPDGTAADAARATPTRPLQMTDQILDPVYSSIEQEVATRRAKLSSYEKKQAELIGRYGIGRAERAQLAALYADEIALGRLEAETSLAGSIHAELVRKHEDARLQVISRTAELQILDPATRPDSQVAPRPRVYAIIGLLIGFALAVLGVTARYYLAGPQSRVRHAIL